MAAAKMDRDCDVLPTHKFFARSKTTQPAPTKKRRQTASFSVTTVATLMFPGACYIHRRIN